MTVRAAVLSRSGEPLRIEELEQAPPRPGEVLVRMEASGVCHSDLHQAEGDWDDPGPMVLGHEGAGRVEALGPGVSGLSEGDLVGLSWFYPCLTCEQCRLGQTWACTGNSVFQDRLPDGTTRLSRPGGEDVLQMLGLGTFAERAVVPAAAAIPFPSEVPPEVAALIGCSVSTGVMAVLRAADLKPGASVAVIGLGGVGLSAVMGAVQAKAGRIVAVDRVESKLDHARALGATHVVLGGGDPKDTKAAIREAAGGRPDNVLECIGLPATLELAIDMVGASGTVVAVGIPPLRERASFDVGYLIDRSARIIGANYGWAVPDRDFPRLAELYLDGSLPVDRLIEERIGLDQVNRAFEALRTGEGLRRVIVF
jgi:Zn-dependent alcohol dehydrogenase